MHPLLNFSNNYSGIVQDFKIHSGPGNHSGNLRTSQCEGLLTELTSKEGKASSEDCSNS